MGRRTIDAGLLAAITGGAATAATAKALADAPETVETAGVTKTPIAATVEKPAVVAETVETVETAVVAAGDEKPVVAAVVPPAATTPDALTAHLTSENSRLQGEIVTLKLAASKTDELVTSLKAQVEPMHKIVATACERIAISLGGTPVGLDKLDGVKLCEQWNELSAKFNDRFKIGPQTTAAAETQDNGDEKGLKAVPTQTKPSPHVRAATLGGKK